MLYLIRISAILILTLTSIQAAELTFNNGKNTYPIIKMTDGQRLNQFYTKIGVSRDTNWQTALLTSPSAQQKFQEQSEKLKTKLDKLENYWIYENKLELVQSLRQLKHELFQLNVAGRIKTELDPDLIRLHPEYNRPLIGLYTLYAAPHISEIYLLGLMNGKSDATLQSGWSVEQYADETVRLPGANKSYGYLIDGSGSWQKVPLASWNKKHIEPAPGSTLFIGFEPAELPDEMTDLNELIADYIANRIPQ